MVKFYTKLQNQQTYKVAPGDGQPSASIKKQARI
jgi:hypothetical protein